MNKRGRVMGGALLVAGTAIGGGMLALPVLTSLGGFIPSLAIYFASWLFMACTGLLFLEVCLWTETETNIVSMAHRTLGHWGRYAAWGLYLFMFYTLTVAYVTGSGNLVVDLMKELFALKIPDWAGTLGFIFIFAPFVYIGAGAVDRMNVFLMLGLGLSYAGFVILGFKYVNSEVLFKNHNWTLSLIALPVAFTSFGYQGIVPTLVSYLGFNAKKVKAAIFIGSFMALATYIVWEWLILGIVPSDGPGGLAEALKNNYNAVRPLKDFIHSPFVVTLGQYFAFFALVTSFLGVTLGLRDFLADGLSVKKDRKGRLMLCLLVFLPPLLLSFIYPYIFIEALQYAGGFGAALLLGLLPIIMVWRGRYHLGLQGEHQLKGGKATLVVLIFFVIIELVCEIAHLSGSFVS